MAVKHILLECPKFSEIRSDLKNENRPKDCEGCFKGKQICEGRYDIFEKYKFLQSCINCKVCQRSSQVEALKRIKKIKNRSLLITNSWEHYNAKELCITEGVVNGLALFFLNFINMTSAPLESLVRVEERFNEQDKPVDREKTCPLLLRVFCCTGRHNSPADYRGGKVPSNELQIYTWLDATLREITGLVKEVNEDARARGTMFDFSLVYPHQATPGYRFRHIGTTVTGQSSPSDNRTLASLRFNIGEFIDVCITPPSRVTPNMMRRGGGGRQY